MADLRAVERVRGFRRVGLGRLYPDHVRVTVGMGTCGRAAGASEVLDALRAEVVARGLAADVVAVGCRGACWAEPLVEVQLPGRGRALYGGVAPADCARIVESAGAGALWERKLIGIQYRDDFPLVGESNGVAPCDGRDVGRLPFFAVQNRRVTGKCGHVDPRSVEEYAAYGGYVALARTIDAGGGADVVDVLERSGLRGRGGAGFPTGVKWRRVREAASDAKYVVANADEGDPGAFMDRSLVEGDPHALIEGMALAGLAVGATRGYVFTRSEYPLAAETLESAIRAAREAGVLGKHVLGSGFSFDVRVVRSAGAFVCGEATALVRAMEGHPGRPRKRPPHLSERGLWGRPTCLNNVETFANVPLVVACGAKWFREVGTEESPGTKVFSVAGAVGKTGLVEVPMGLPASALRDALADGSSADAADGAAGGAAGGVDAEAGEGVARSGAAGNAAGGSDAAGSAAGVVRAFQIGGPSGVVLPASLDFSLDFESLGEVGGSIGSGGIVFLGERDCVVETVRYLTDFSRQESCGQCSACADGLARCSELLRAVTDGEASCDTLGELERVAERMEAEAFCGLGRMAARPILSSLRFFEDEYRAHLDLRCPGKVCKRLIRFSVIERNCPGCRCCKPTCPTNAMQGRFGKPYHIDERLCIRCWMCTATCPYGAIAVHAGARS